MSVGKKQLMLRVVTPEGVAAETACDGVILPLADDADGDGGGSMGVHAGHEAALMALGAGEVRAKGDTPLTVQIEAGLASVERDVVTVVTDRCTLVG